MESDVSNQESNASKATSDKIIPAIGEQGVADYLRRHPTFFEDKPTLLADLRVPHTAGTAVSLVERQVAVLRESNAKLQEQLEGLLQVARTNDKLNALLHTFTLRIIECDSLDDLLALIHKQLHRDFSADLVAVRLLASVNDTNITAADVFPEDADAFCGLFRRVLTVGKPFCGQLDAEQLQSLFGEQSESVVSSALLPLGKAGALGVVVIGSFERDRFHSGVDTAFLQNLSEVISAALARFVSKD
jgi:uncharacterized protein YigA (DUF484 family)